MMGEAAQQQVAGRRRRFGLGRGRGWGGGDGRESGRLALASYYGRYSLSL